MTKFSQTKEAPQFSIHQTTVLAHKEFFDAASLIRTATIKSHNPSSKLSLDYQIHSKPSYCKSGQPQNSSNQSEQNLNTSQHWAFLDTGKWPTWTSFLKKSLSAQGEREARAHASNCRQENAFVDRPFLSLAARKAVAATSSAY